MSSKRNESAYDEIDTQDMRSTSAAEEQEEEYSIEKIVNKRTINGKHEYCLKWKNFSDEDNTWEPEENIECKELIREYEEQVNKFDNVANDDQTAIDVDSTDEDEMEDSSEGSEDDEDDTESVVACLIPSGNQKVPEKIVGATDFDGQLMFLLKWKDTEDTDLIPARAANIMYPQIVINFYEERLTWSGAEDMDA